MGTEYVFLAGDNDVIPARIALVRLGYGEDDYVLSDYYYMCLDGTWNADGDDVYGEIEDSIDLYPEVNVTRGTFHNAQEFSKYLERIKKFEKDPISYVNRAIFHSSTIQAGGDGSEYINQIASAFPDSVLKVFLYQDDSVITITTINNYLRSGAGYFVTMAHGDINGFYANYSNIYYGMSAIPDDTTSATLVDIFSCHSGAIDRMCLLEAFFGKGISVAARASSRNDFSFTTSMRVTFYNLLSEGKTLGEATSLFRLPYLTYGTSGDNGYRYVMLSMITLGEPLLRFYTKNPVRLRAKVTEDSGLLRVSVSDENDMPAKNAVVTLYKEGEYFIQDTTEASGFVEIPLKMLSYGKHYLTVTGFNYVRLDTTVNISFIGYPELKNIDVIGSSPPKSGDSVEIRVQVGLPGFYPVKLAVTAYIQDSILCSDTVRMISGTDYYYRKIYIPYFSGTKRMLVRAELVGKNVMRDTVFEVGGPFISLSGIGLENNLFYLWLGNSGIAVDRGIVKIHSTTKDTIIYVTLPGNSIVRCDCGIFEDPDFPLGINIHTKVFDTTFIVKSINIPSPPTGITATSISRGVALKWTGNGLTYNIYRGTDSIHLYRLNIQRLEFPYYTDEGLSYDTVYYYAITSVDSSGFESNISEVVKGIPNPPLKSGWPATGSGLGYSSPLVADITPLYPGKEIIIGSFEDSLLYAFSSGGLLLPGWPVKIDGIIYASPAAYDFDGDGFDEVVIAGFSCRKLWIFKGDGSPLEGWPVYLPNGSFTGPAIGDVNHDSVPEIVFVSRKGGVYVYDMYGVMLDSLHLYAGGFSPATLGDIDGDDTVEIITGCKVDTAGLWVMHMAGDTNLVVDSGFPKGPYGFNSPLVVGDVVDTLEGLEIFGCSTGGYAVLYDAHGDTLWSRPTNNVDFFYAPSISDLDGDSIPELIVNQGTGVAVFRNNGDYLYGYPTTLASGGPSQCVTLDMNGDGYKEMVKGSVDGKLYALTRGALIYPGFPIDLLGYAYPTSTVSDIDYDGKLELITSSFANLVFVYDLGIPDSLVGDWPTYQHDNQRTGNYNFNIWEESSIKESNCIYDDRANTFIVNKALNLSNIFERALEIDIYDITGRHIGKFNTDRNNKTVLQGGIYFMVGKDKKGKIYKKRLVVVP